MSIKYFRYIPQYIHGTRLLRLKLDRQVIYNYIGIAQLFRSRVADTDSKPHPPDCIQFQKSFAPVYGRTIYRDVICIICMHTERATVFMLSFPVLP